MLLIHCWSINFEGNFSKYRLNVEELRKDEMIWISSFDDTNGTSRTILDDFSKRFKVGMNVVAEAMQVPCQPSPLKAARKVSS
mmetsp:Transcript_46709/g.56133  ORF Transcript_46709/g.56133 Transcript_46709/m.56133 type:complete len:83 (-) Transcript_46709:46-294(-)